MLDSRPTVAWPPITVAWPFSDFLQKVSQIARNVQKRCLTVGRQSRDLRSLSRDPSVTFYKKFPKLLERSKNVVWQSADGRVTSDHCRVTVQWFFSKFSQIAWNVQKRCLTVGRRSRDLRPLSRDPSVTLKKKLILILAGKFPLVDSLWGKQVPHYKHKRRSITYLREIPVKNRESWGRRSTHGKIVG